MTRARTRLLWSAVAAAAVVGVTAGLLISVQPHQRDRSPAARWLATYPEGGRRTGPDEITYTTKAGYATLVMRFTRPGSRPSADPDCPAKRLCLYAGPHYTYPRGELLGCAWIDLAWFGWARHVRSIQNNFPPGPDPAKDPGLGTVEFLHHDRTQRPNTDTTVLSAPPAVQLPDVPATADYLYHFCTDKEIRP